jgi:hypothetical protein
MSLKEKKLDRDLSALLDAIFSLKVGNWEADFAPLLPSLKKKAKVTPLSSRPMFIQVVGSSSNLLAHRMIGAAAATATAM